MGYIEVIKYSLSTCESQSNIGYKVDSFKETIALINGFQDTHLRETFKGKEFYSEAFGHWQKIAQEQLIELQFKAANAQPITPNPYRKGEALTKTEKAVFLGREDLKEQISLKILTATSMPMLLIQGQRRVGKTSLLNFLPNLLDKSKFKVVYQDLQAKELIRSIPTWFEDLRYQINHTLKLTPPTGKEIERWKAPDDWLEAWKEMREYLEKVSADKQYKIILAFDEYEELHKMLAAEPEKGGHLLAAMRSYSQRQDKVVFMFIGAALFSELSNPAWSTYFVQTERFKVGYLKKKDSLKLITQPTAAFSLKYEAGLAEQIFEDTQGHPHLLQFICSEMVDFANQNNIDALTVADYERIKNEKVLDRESQPFSVFWIEFCEKIAMKKVVIAISQHEKPVHRGSVIRLAEHEFIIEKNGAQRMRVPLFEAWVRKFGYVEED